jgi:23S rRNA (uracil1939-C5)-methyltransferase
MLARHQGQVVLVAGAIPGERVRVHVDRRARGVSYAVVDEVLAPSDARRPGVGDPRCGGRSYAHIAYPSQLELKRAIVVDALARIGHCADATVLATVGSPEHGYRTRARLHVARGRVGFVREGSQDVCPFTEGAVLSAPMTAALETMAARLDRSLKLLAEIDVVESVDATERAWTLRWLPSPDARRAASRVGVFEGWTGGWLETGSERRALGAPWVFDELPGTAGTLRLRHQPTSFFQGNRYLLSTLARMVVARVEAPVIDLYAGVGLFGLLAAANALAPVELVEGEPSSAADLRVNCEAFGPKVTAVQHPVETYLRHHPPPRGATVIVDPPRTGLSAAVVAALAGRRVRRIVYVSCDPPTFARDARALIAAGYGLDGVQPLDLFPGTAHVELVATFR